MLLLILVGCRSVLGPVDADDARRWAASHGPTLAALEARARELMVALPSLPGDRFFCRETIAPPGLSEAAAEQLREALCRQQEAAWHAERHEAEEDLGVRLLNGAFQRYGVAGAALSIAGPGGEVEWADHRGLWTVGGEGAVPSDAPGAVPWGEGDAARIGWGRVTLGPDDAPGEPVWALEWRTMVERRSAAATVRLILLADGTPDAAFVRRALGTEDEPEPVRIPVPIP